jgi:outer membrane protein assembly factor BamB
VTDRPGSDWAEFLGPSGTGVSPETGLLKVWPVEGPPVVWQKRVGTGYSAPSVRGNRLVVHHRLRNEEIVECLNATTGETVWTYAYPSNFSDPYGYNNGPRCSPLLTDTHCYTFGAEGRLLCVTLDQGKFVWERNTGSDYTVPEGFFGVGCTPILEGNKLITLVGGQPNAGIVAFDSLTGKTLWEAVGQKTWDSAETGWSGSEAKYKWQGDEMIVSYASPIAATIHGQRHILCLMRQGLVSINPETGAENFKYWFRSRTHESVNAARPVVVDDTILLTAAYRVGAVLLKVQPDGRGTSVVWQSDTNMLAHWSTPIYLEGCYYGFSGRHENEGELRCLDAETGKVLWKTPGWERHNDLASDGQGGVIDTSTGKNIPFPYYGRGSKILADGKFIVLAERGTLALVEPSRDGWQEISRCSAPEMSYPSWAAPVLSRGFLYLRDEDSLVCLDLRTQGEEPVGKAVVK